MVEIKKTVVVGMTKQLGLKWRNSWGRNKKTVGADIKKTVGAEIKKQSGGI